MAPLSTSNLPLVGRLVPQNDSSGLADVSTVFNNFIHGKDSNVIVYGDSAGPSDVRHALCPRSLINHTYIVGIGDVAQPSYQDAKDRDVAPEPRDSKDHNRRDAGADVFDVLSG